MNHIELLDGLYRTRAELLRLLIACAKESVDPAKLQELVHARESITWTINSLLDGRLLSSVGHIEDACKEIDDAAKQLKELTDVANDIDKAVGYAKTALGTATSVVAALKV